MSRHRNIRGIDADEEYDGYYACYGHSVEDDFCLSPRTQEEFLYNRNAEKHNMSSYFSATEEENSEEEASSESVNYDKLSGVDAAKLQSCVEALQNVVGDTISEDLLKNAAFSHDFDVEQALNAVLTGSVSESSKRLNIVKSDASGSLISSSNVPSGNVSKAEESPDLNIGTGNIDKKVTKANIAAQEKSDLTPSRVNINSDESLKESAAKPMNLETPASIKSSPKESAAKPNNSETPTSTKNTKLVKDATKTYEEERDQGKLLINMAVVGHVDAGKSTIMGHLLYKLGEISKRTMHKFEQDSKKLGKSSFMYAWVLDETAEERNRGITMEVAQSKFETEHKTVVLLDAPGHKDFIPNMITAAAEADVAILVVDSTRGEFETGFEAGGQTREHTMLIRSLGVTQVAVAVNKMDNIQWSQDRYKEITNKLSSFLKQAGFQESDIIYVPCSGLTGENLVDAPQSPELTEWYSGPTLVSVIDNFRPPQRLINKPFRMCIGDVFKGLSGGFCASGKIEAGYMKSGEKVLVMPAAEQAIIKSMSVNEVPQQHIFAGDHVIMQLAGIDMTNVQRGSMICEITFPIRVTSRFRGQIVVFGIQVPITKGFPVIMHYQNVSEQAIIKKLVSQLHRSTGEVVKKNPRFLTKNSSAVVELETALPICIELYKDFKELGRFMLRSGGTTIAAGLVTEIL